ncbi:MAG: chromate resistance protein ChrB domain-containing protein [Candidatus Brocadiales bacterium]
MKKEWLLLMYSLPLKASRERMSLWRKFKQLGAVSLKSSVYILPSSADTYEEFQWLSQEIQSFGGEATLVKTRGIENLDYEKIIGLFNDSRDSDYSEIIKACEALLKKSAKWKETVPAEEDGLSKELKQIAKKLKALQEIDFFNSPLSREANKLFQRCTRALEARRRRLKPSAFTPLRKENFQGKTWVTRKRPHVDRLASAWLIRRFIDPHANFLFQMAGEQMPEGSIPFDTIGGELSHQGEDCTIETLLKRFAVKEPVVWEIARIVHDADLKDGKYGKEEAKWLNLLLKGMTDMQEDDASLLEEGVRLFDYLYRALKKG